MIAKYRFGSPFPTEATVVDLPCAQGSPAPFCAAEPEEGGRRLGLHLSAEDIVYGLGEQPRGINKRGWIYRSWNTDDPIHTEGIPAMYGSHNFFVVCGEKPFGAFFDCAGRMTFDVGYTDPEELTVTAYEDFDLYIIRPDGARETAENQGDRTPAPVLSPVEDIVRQFRALIGQSYIPPKWGFGYAQSRWGYASEGDIREVADGYAEAELPLDAVYLDIDYMERYKDFTVDLSRYPDLKGLNAEMAARGIHLVPIVDAAVKVEDGYPVYEEGVEKGYFCKDAEGIPYVVGVWPGDSVLPDVLNADAREWFGSGYKFLLDMGIEGFWNDMNEPALFYGKKRLETAIEKTGEYKGKNIGDIGGFWKLSGLIGGLKNSDEDYNAFYHDTAVGRVCHGEVHNLYGYYMTRSAAEYFEKYAPDKRFLLFSRSSYIGMHRYGGIWTGDNCSWWSHILLNLKMLPSLNMCGFLYVGADLGGFGENTTEDLLLRWLALGVFTPLMRNHTTLGTRNQECYRFKNRKTFADVLSVRYAIFPYLYSEYVACALEGRMLFRPLSFAYPSDKRARGVEDQLLFGDSAMIAPVYEQNAKGRYVYLPERMKLVRMRGAADVSEEIWEAGDHFMEVEPGEVAFFLRPGKVMPLAADAAKAKNLASLDESKLVWLKFISEDTEYRLCRDEDGYRKSSLKDSFVRVVVKA